MTERIQCFWLEPSDIAECRLRRYSTARTCPTKWEYHNASVDIGQVPYPIEKGYDGEYSNSDPDKSNPRWPSHCECGYAFQDSDEWQTGKSRMYRRVDTGELHILGAAPVGAMWYASWLVGLEKYDRGSGEVLVVRTPGGDWVVDGPSNTGGHWTRTGVPPEVTASPSIICGDYHGFLVKGFLEKC